MPEPPQGGLLVFDLGRHLGYAACGPRFRPRSPLEIGAGAVVEDYESGSALISAEDDHFRGRALLTTQSVVRSLVERYRPRRMAFESVLQFTPGEARFRLLVGMASVIEMIAAEAEPIIPTEEVANSRWRKHFTGHGGKTDKARTLRSCVERGYGEFDSTDRGDATGILDFVATQHLQRQQRRAR